MTVIENHCVDCAVPGYPCLGRSCPNVNVEVHYCDGRGCGRMITEIYYLDGEELCEECFVEYTENS